MVESMKLDLTRIDIEDFGDEVVLLELATGAYWSVKGGLIAVARGLRAGASLEQVSEWAASDLPADVAKGFLAALADRGLLAEGEPVSGALDGLELPAGEPRYSLFEELSDLVKLDPIHDVGTEGWPHKA